MSDPQDIRDAFAAGRLCLIVDAPRELDRVPFVGDAMHEGARGRVVHVMSRPAGGEIRGYVMLDDDGMLRERCPRPIRWREMDLVVAERLGASRIVRHSAHDPGGSAEALP